MTIIELLEFLNAPGWTPDSKIYGQYTSENGLQLVFSVKDVELTENGNLLLKWSFRHPHEI